MTTSGIVVTLPSSSSKSEFPNNKTSSYKIRLPYPLELNGKWEVGLSSITLPDTYLEMSILKDLNTFELKTVRNYIGDNVEVPKNNTAILGLFSRNIARIKTKEVIKRTSYAAIFFKVARFSKYTI